MAKDLSDGKVTIYEVAEEAGVSVATVSRVLNESEKVAENTAARVEAAIAALRYQPNRTARTLAEPDRRVLAVALPSFITPFHNELLKGIRSRLNDFECDFLLRDLGSENAIEELAEFLRHGTVDGLIVVGTDIEGPANERLNTWRAPAVVVGSRVEGLDCFYWDDAAGGRLGTEHLLELGHRRIGLVRSARAGFAFHEQRVEAYQKTLEEAGIAYDPALVAGGTTTKHAGFSEEAGYEAMQQLLEDAPDVTAVLAMSDVQAMGAWAALRESGRSVPEDVSVVGYDDVKTSRFVGLTSVAQRMHYVGEEAIDCLLDRIRGGPRGAEDAHHEKVVPTLSTRMSSRPPANA